MMAMNRHTGKRIDNDSHLRQSIADILSTPVGTRVMRRAYGSLLPELIDQPLNDATVLRIYAATVFALMQWEPRIQIQTVRVSTSEPGSLSLYLHGIRADTGGTITIDAISLRGAV